MTRPDIIKPRHLERLAVGYGRQSTPDQVENREPAALPSTTHAGQLIFDHEFARSLFGVTPKAKRLCAQ